MSRNPVRRTKIVATLGPAWDDPAKMAALIDAGVNVVRINASHGTPEIRERWIERAPGGHGRPAGFRRRSCSTCRGLASASARWPQPLRLDRRADGRLRPRGRGPAGEIPTTYEALAADVRLGARILLDDGLLSLEVTGVRDGRVDAVVHYGGRAQVATRA